MSDENCIQIGKSYICIDGYRLNDIEMHRDIYRVTDKVADRRVGR